MKERARHAATLGVVAIGYGFVAGIAAAACLAAMFGVEHVVWSVSDARWYVFVAICVGGAIIAALRRYGDESDLDEQVASAQDPIHLGRMRTLVLAASAVVAVGFGGAVGPEAGMIAVVAELSALVSLRLVHAHETQRLIGQAGTAAALAGVYGSPPGAAVYDDDTLSPPKAFSLAAALAGLVGFALSMRVIDSGFSLRLDHLEYSRDDVALLLCVVPAALASVLGLAYLAARQTLRAGLAKVGGVTTQTLVGTVVFAALMTAWPELRFSGHHDVEWLADLAEASAWATLAGFAAAKLLAMALCISSGWRGGEYFPLLIAGAAIGAAAAVALPGLSVAEGMAAAGGAATVVGLRKPIAALLVGVFIVGVALGPLVVGALVGAVVVRVATEPLNRALLRVGADELSDGH